MILRGIFGIGRLEKHERRYIRIITMLLKLKKILWDNGKYNPPTPGEGESFYIGFILGSLITSGVWLVMWFTGVYS